MSYLTLGYRLPQFLSAPLFGDRKRFGLVIQKEDPDWKEWEHVYLNFYYKTQKESIGDIVNKAGYKILNQVDFDNKIVLEVGPGDIDHLEEWEGGRPNLYVIADVRQDMLDRSVKKLRATDIPFAAKLLNRDSNGKLPFNNVEFDIIISFYAFEHLFSFKMYLKELLRVLKPGGIITGAIPCEGGLAWGIGRFSTSRRWFIKNTNINPDKIICWEHPNFADHILYMLDEYMIRKTLQFWPFHIPSIDLNLVASFIYRKK